MLFYTLLATPTRPVIQTLSPFPLRFLAAVLLCTNTVSFSLSPRMSQILSGDATNLGRTEKGQGSSRGIDDDIGGIKTVLR